MVIHTATAIQAVHIHLLLFGFILLLIYFLLNVGGCDCWTAAVTEPGEIFFGLVGPFISLTSFSGNCGAKFSKRLSGKGTHLFAYRIPDEHIGDPETAVMYCQQPQDLTVD